MCKDGRPCSVDSDFYKSIKPELDKIVNACNEANVPFLALFEPVDGSPAISYNASVPGFTSAVIDVVMDTLEMLGTDNSYDAPDKLEPKSAEADASGFGAFIVSSRVGNS